MYASQRTRCYIKIYVHLSLCKMSLRKIAVRMVYFLRLLVSDTSPAFFVASACVYAKGHFILSYDRIILTTCHFKKQTRLIKSLAEFSMAVAL